MGECFIPMEETVQAHVFNYHSVETFNFDGISVFRSFALVLYYESCRGWNIHLELYTAERLAYKTSETSQAT